MRAALLVLLLCLSAANYCFAQTPLVKSEKGENLKGIELFKKRVSDNPKDYLSLKILADLYLKDAKQLADIDSYILAESTARQALRHKADYVAAQLALINALMGQHKFSEAQDISESILKSDSSNVLAQISLADALYEIGDYEKAKAIIERLPEEWASEASILYRRASFLELNGESDEALKLLALAVKLAAQNSDDAHTKSWYHLRLGERYLKVADLKNAETQFQLAKKLTPDSAFPIEHLAELEAIKKNFEKSLSLFSEAFSLTPRPELLQAQGDVLSLQGKSQLALEFYNKAITLYQASACKQCYYHHLAGLYSDSLLDPERALEYARKDNELRKTFASFDALAWALFRAGKYQEAKVAIDRAGVQGTRDAYILYHASMIYGANADLKKSRELLEIARAINPYVNSFHLHR